MATVETTLMTAEEFYEWAHRDENRGKNCDLVRGEIVAMTRPGRFHGFVCANTVCILGSFARQRRKGYVCSNDTGVVVERDPDTVRGPDVLFYEDAESAEDIPPGYGEEPLRLAVEVLSPNDTLGSLMPRIADQLRFGTPLVWVLDPEARNVTVFRPGKEPYVVATNGELTGDEVLPDFRCQVAEFFALPRR